MEVKTIRKFLNISLIKSINFLWRWSLPATGRWRRPWPPTRRSCENWGHWSSTTTPRVAGAGSWSWWPAASTSSSSAPRRSSPPSSSASANPAQSPGNYSPNSLGLQVSGQCLRAGVSGRKISSDWKIIFSLSVRRFFLWGSCCFCLCWREWRERREKLQINSKYVETDSVIPVHLLSVTPHHHRLHHTTALNVPSCIAINV